MINTGTIYRNVALERSFYDHYVTMPGEKMICAVRSTWLVMLWSLVNMIGLWVMTSVVIFVVMFLTRISYWFGISMIGLVSMILITAITKVVADWYFHFYIVTNRKILEVWHSPLISHSTNEVLLDQVRVTEIDVATGGIVEELLNIGSIKLVFDRPSHDESFTLKNIENPKKVGSLLADNLESLMSTQPVWFGRTNRVSPVHFSEDALAHQ